MADLDDQIEKDMLLQIPPEKREEFKKVYRFTRYKEGSQFFVLWHLFLFLYSFPLVLLERAIFPFLRGLDQFLFQSPILSLLVFSFFHMIVLVFFTKGVKAKINQRGINAVHISLIVGLVILVVMGFLGRIQGLL